MNSIPKNSEDNPESRKSSSLNAYWKELFHRSYAEEWANFGTHFAGAVFGLFALTFMCVKTAETGDARKIVSAAIYGSTLLVLYTASALYHLVWKFSVKSVLQILDHVCIYLLIAGSYTPFVLVALRDSPLGIWFLVITWVLAAAGIATELLVHPRKEWLALLITLALGWEILFFLRPVMNFLDLAGFVLLVVGGGLYTAGVIFYSMDRTPYMHTVWHCFVLAASVCHWVAIQFSIF